MVLSFIATSSHCAHLSLSFAQDVLRGGAGGSHGQRALHGARDQFHAAHVATVHSACSNQPTTRVHMTSNKIV